MVWPVPPAPRGVEMKIVCSATRHTAAREIARILADTGARWEERIRALPAATALPIS
jgi:hypothetical protein